MIVLWAVTKVLEKDIEAADEMLENDGSLNEEGRSQWTEMVVLARANLINYN